MRAIFREWWDVVWHGKSGRNYFGQDGQQRSRLWRIFNTRRYLPPN